MEAKLLYENTDGTGRIFFNEEKQTLILAMYGKQQLATYKELHSKMLELFPQYGVKRGIYDLREMTSDPATARAWLVGQFLPRLSRTVPKGTRIAVLDSANQFQQIVTKIVLSSVQKLGFPFTVTVKPDEESAFVWLAEEV